MDLRILIEPQEGASYEDQLAAAQWAEDYGFSGFFRTDHYLPLGLGPAKGPRSPSDSWITLAALARETRHIRLGTMVTAATFRHPGSLAISVSQVDAMSGGRIELGIGAGWNEAEHVAFGIPFPPLTERLCRLEETVEILDHYWSTPIGSTFDFTGNHYTLRDCPALPKPRQSSVPLIIGGKGGPRSLRIAAAHADEYNLDFPRPGHLQQVLPRLEEACADAGREALLLSASHLACVGKDDHDLLDRAQRAGLDLSLDLGGLIGTVDQIGERLAKLEEQGLRRFYLQVPDLADRDHFDALAQLL